MQNLYFCLDWDIHLKLFVDSLIINLLNFTMEAEINSNVNDLAAKRRSKTDCTAYYLEDLIYLCPIQEAMQQFLIQILISGKGISREPRSKLLKSHISKD